MITNYKQNNGIVSPFQIRKPYDISRKDHPAQDEIKSCVGTFTLSITVEQDLEALKLFEHIPGGLVAFKTTVSSNGQVLGVGRNSSIFTKVNKYLSRTVRSAFCGSLIDAVVKSCRSMDAIYLAGPEYRQNTVGTPNEQYVETKEVEEFVPITEKQKNFLWRLLSAHSASEESFAEIGSLSKDEARERINRLVNAGDR